jgi:hypothetical protein
MHVDMTARRVMSRVASRVSKHDHRKFQALRLVHGHHPYTLRAFLDDRSLVGFATFGVSFEFLDKGAEGGSAALEKPSYVDQPLTVCERLLAIWPKRDPGVGPYRLK